MCLRANPNTAAAEPEGSAVKGKISIPEEIVRDAAYASFGASMYHAMKGRVFPVSSKVKGKGPFYIEVDWEKMRGNNIDSFPYTPLSYIDYGETKALLTVFNVSFMDGIDGDFNRYFNAVKDTPFLPKNERDKIMKYEPGIRAKSIFYLVAFPLKDVRLAYYPGENYYRGGTSPKLGKWAEGVSETVKNGADTSHCRVQDPAGLLAVFNGTFYRLDSGKAGCGFNHNVMFAPADGMATVAIYDDGSMKMGAYENLPEKEKISTFTQNRYAILENGKPAAGYYPKKFIKYTDNIIRSYLFMKGGEYAGYIWTTYMPQEIAAKTALNMGITDMMLLDIHSVINCAVAKSGEKLTYAAGDEFRKKSFTFVPTFKNIRRFYLALKASELVGRPIQDDAVYCLFDRSPNDIFAFFLKKPPEAGIKTGK